MNTIVHGAKKIKAHKSGLLNEGNKSEYVLNISHVEKKLRIVMKIAGPQIHPREIYKGRPYKIPNNEPGSSVFVYTTGAPVRGNCPER